MKLKTWKTSLLFAVLISTACAKKSKRMTDMLKEASEDKATHLNEPTKKDNEVADNCKTCKPGFHMGRPRNPFHFEYKDKHSVMTPEEAVEICEKDQACAGFSFYGVHVPGRKHFVYFVHYIPFDDKAWSMNAWTWSTYRSKKKVLVLPGKPHLQHVKFPTKLTKEFEEGIYDSWPFQKLAAVAVSDDKAIGSDSFRLQDHDFKAEGWRTLINNEEFVHSIVDGTSRQFEKCCKSYDKPLVDVHFRFTPEIHDNIQVVECEDLKKKGMDEFVEMNVPLKIVNCAKKDLNLKDLKWTGIVDQNGKDFHTNGDITEEERRDLSKNDIKLKFKTDSLEQGKYLQEKFMPEHLGQGDVDTKATFVSQGGGQSLLSTSNEDAFDQLLDGKKWWVISPPGFRMDLRCSSCDPDKKISEFWHASSWFDNMQPQICLTRFDGQYFKMTMQNPGDIIYVPSSCKMAFYAVEDSMSITQRILTYGGIDVGENEVSATKLKTEYQREILKKARENKVKAEEGVDEMLITF